MAQIPVFQDSQILQPSAPVQIGNVDQTTNEAVAGFGKALFTFGNTLDQYNKKAKTEQDRTTVAILKAQYGKDMLLLRAQQAAKGIAADEPADGTGGVNDFNESLTKVRQKYLKMLPSEMQEKFLAATGEDELENNVKVLAEEVKKREENLPVLRQIFVNEIAEKARSNPGKLVEALSEVEIHIAKDETIPEIDRVAAIVDAKKQISRGFIDGFTQRGYEGQVDQFEQGRKFARENLGLIFSPDELDKEIVKINQAEIGYNNRVYTEDQRNDALRKKDFQAKNQQAMTLYTGLLKNAENNQFKFNEIQKKISVDPRLTADDKKAFEANRVFMESSDDQYEGMILSRLFSNKKTDKLSIGQANDLVEADYIKGNVSADRRTKMLKYFNDIKDSQRRDPTIERLVSQYYGKIESLSLPKTVFDIDSQMVKGQIDQKNATVKVQFAQALSQLSAEGKYTPANIESVFNKVVGNAYKGDPLATLGGFGSGKNKIPPGTNVNVFEDPKGLQKEIEKEARRGIANPKERGEAAKRIRVYQQQLDRLNKDKKINEVIKPSQGGGKRFDE